MISIGFCFVDRHQLDEARERLRAGAEISVIVSEIGLLADDAEKQIALEPALADARIENRRFLARDWSRR